MSNTNCVGTESRLVDCPHSTGGSGSAVNLSCTSTGRSSEKLCAVFNSTCIVIGAQYLAPCRYGDIRLSGGHSQYEGRVEMCSFRNRWGTVCNRHWTQANSRVVCHSLGYSEEGRTQYKLIIWPLFWFTFSAGSHQIFYIDNRGLGIFPVGVDYVKCQSSDNSLKECIHFSHSYGCSHDEDVEVYCKPGKCNTETEEDWLSPTYVWLQQTVMMEM